MERSIEIFAAIHCCVFGLSHMLQPRAWVDFFILLREKGKPGVFFNGFVSLTLGAVVVAFHNVWSGLPCVLTIVGWIQVAKGFAAFVFPDFAGRGMRQVSPERAWQFVGAGAFLLCLGGIFLTAALRSWP